MLIYIHIILKIKLYACDLAHNKPPISDLMSAGSQTLFNRPQNTIVNNQSEQELQESQQNRHLAFGSTNIAAPNMEFNGSGNRYKCHQKSVKLR